MNRIPFLFAAIIFFYFGFTAARGKGWGNSGGPGSMDIRFQRNPKLGLAVGVVLISLGIVVAWFGVK